MKPIKVKLTKALIDQMVFEGSSTSAADVRYDAELPGFGVRVWPSGRRTFVLRYRFNRRDRYYTIGRYGPLTLKEGRDMAKLAQADVLRGKDPAQERRRNRQGRTVSQLCDDYLAKHAKKKRSYEHDRLRVEKYVRKAWGSRQVKEIDQATVQALHDKVSAKYPIAANRLLSLLSKMFNFAIYYAGEDENGIRYRYLDANAVNPTRWVQPNPENKRRVYLKPEETSKYFEAVQEEPNIYLRGFFLLMPLVLLRKGNLLRAKWDWVDHRTKTLHVPDSKSGSPIDIHLSSLAKGILDAMPRQAGNPYIFCGARTGKHLVNVDDAWQRIRKRLGREELWIHDFRRLANWMLESGEGSATVSKILTHADDKTTRRHYGFVLGKKERDALNKHSKAFGGLLGGTAKIRRSLKRSTRSSDVSALPASE